MRYTYDLNEHGCLILIAEPEDLERIREFEGDYTLANELDALESLIANSELDWIGPEEIGALTDAPILGIRDENHEPIAAWGFMDYQVRSFLEDLLHEGQAVFIS